MYFNSILTTYYFIACFTFVLSHRIVIGQTVAQPSRAICQIVTDDGRSGSGFVVAADGSKFEVWTNAHVAGTVGQSVEARFRPYTSSEQRFRGVVRWVNQSKNTDASKIIADGNFTDAVCSIGIASNTSDLLLGGGYPLGGRFYSVGLTRTPARDFGRVVAYRPASIEGQSGGPVFDSHHHVIGVTTLRLGDRRTGFGGVLPITDWSNPDSHSISSANGIGEFKPLGLSKVVHPVDD